MSIVNYDLITYAWKGQHWVLHPLKGMYWKEKDRLLVTDLHLGKTQHFRNAGIHVPNGADRDTLSHLKVMIEHFCPAEVWLLGDLFHSQWETNSWNVFKEWFAPFSQLDWHLILGNHDIYPPSYYESLNIQCHDEFTESNQWRIQHAPPTEKGDIPTISGHIHPGVDLRGKGKQRLRLPCFYFGAHQWLLPALGKFTGLATLGAISSTDRIFIATPQSVLEVPLDK
jgi:DNA ligase-associated metallophosphoesterase